MSRFDTSIYWIGRMIESTKRLAGLVEKSAPEKSAELLGEVSDFEDAITVLRREASLYSSESE